MVRTEMETKMTGRDKRVIDLASAINAIMRKHKNRNEALDAIEAARILFRLPR